MPGSWLGSRTPSIVQDPDRADHTDSCMPGRVLVGQALLGSQWALWHLPMGWTLALLSRGGLALSLLYVIMGISIWAAETDCRVWGIEGVKRGQGQ